MRLVIFDAARKPSILDEGWGVGAFSMWFRERTDGMLGALSWEEVFLWLQQRKKDHGLIKELQFWGHGTPGEAYINGEPLTDLIMAFKVTGVAENFKSFMHPEGLWWFRTCSTFHGEEGHKFAKRFSKLINCTVAGHTHKIGFPTHSGLHTIEPFHKPTWNVDEGKSSDGKVQRSYFFRPRTIPFWRNTIPKGW